MKHCEASAEEEETPISSDHNPTRDMYSASKSDSRESSSSKVNGATVSGEESVKNERKHGTGNKIKILRRNDTGSSPQR